MEKNFKNVLDLLFEKIESNFVDVVYYDNTFEQYKYEFEKCGEATISGIILGGNTDDKLLMYLLETFNEIKEKIKNENELTNLEIAFLDSLLFEDVEVCELAFLLGTCEFTFRIHTNPDN